MCKYIVFSTKRHIHFHQQKEWGGFNLENGNLENGDLEGVFALKIVEMGISKTFDGFLQINLINGYLEKCVRN